MNIINIYGFIIRTKTLLLIFFLLVMNTNVSFASDTAPNGLPVEMENRAAFYEAVNAVLNEVMIGIDKSYLGYVNTIRSFTDDKKNGYYTVDPMLAISQKNFKHAAGQIVNIVITEEKYGELLKDIYRNLQELAKQNAEIIKSANGLNNIFYPNWDNLEKSRARMSRAIEGFDAEMAAYAAMELEDSPEYYKNMPPYIKLNYELSKMTKEEIDNLPGTGMYFARNVNEVKILTVNENSPAERSKIEPGDVIRGMQKYGDGNITEIKDILDYHEFMKKCGWGDAITVTLLRNGAENKVTIMLNKENIITEKPAISEKPKSDKSKDKPFSGKIAFAVNTNAITPLRSHILRFVNLDEGWASDSDNDVNNEVSLEGGIDLAHFENLKIGILLGVAYPQTNNFEIDYGYYIHSHLIYRVYSVGLEFNIAFNDKFSVSVIPRNLLYVIDASLGFYNNIEYGSYEGIGAIYSLEVDLKARIKKNFYVGMSLLGHRSGIITADGELEGNPVSTNFSLNSDYTRIYIEYKIN
jgi:hypothetical protein